MDILHRRNLLAERAQPQSGYQKQDSRYWYVQSMCNKGHRHGDDLYHQRLTAMQAARAKEKSACGGGVQRKRRVLVCYIDIYIYIYIYI